MLTRLPQSPCSGGRASNAALVTSKGLSNLLHLGNKDRSAVFDLFTSILHVFSTHSAKNLSMRNGLDICQVATNALLERKGERCCLVTSKGFRDLLHIGNQSRPQIFDLEISIPDVLYDNVVEVDEQVSPSYNAVVNS